MNSPFLWTALEAATSAAAVLVVLISGHRRLQCGLLLIGLACGLIAVVEVDKFSVPKGSPSLMVMIVALGLLAFSGWNLFSRTGERWSFRVVIYGLYAAGFAGVAAYFSTHDSTDLSSRDWVIAGVVYVITSVAIVLTKPWFAARMRS